MSLQPILQIRVRQCNASPVNTGGKYVLYWMTAFRRLRWNFSLDRAVEWCLELSKPLIIFEPLRCGYRWASERFHRFILDGMAEQYLELNNSSVTYYPYLEPHRSASRHHLATLAQHACVVVTDDHPNFFFPLALSLGSQQCPVRMECIDSNGLLPLRSAPGAFSTAPSFRRFFQKNLQKHWQFPSPNPLASLPSISVNIPSHIAKFWPPVSISILKRQKGLDSLPINHNVLPVDGITGGSKNGLTFLNRFIEQRLAVYDAHRNHPDLNVSSQLSPYLHFGHISTHQVFFELSNRQKWTLKSIKQKNLGKSHGWWGMDNNAESFLDQVITWREIGFNFCMNHDQYDHYCSLPMWSRQTLDGHSADPRPFQYDLPTLETANTHDEIWNAAQRQLVWEGRIHNYLRMLWGKKILEWSPSPKIAVARMIELNNRYALDGRDPNSYSGIFWVLGRYDRPWGPERPIFGKVRYMSSDSTRRKLKIRKYLECYGVG